MRLREKEITDRDEIEDILKKEKICYLAMADGDTPYVIPSTFGYADGHLLMHSSKEEEDKGNQKEQQGMHHCPYR